MALVREEKSPVESICGSAIFQCFKGVRVSRNSGLGFERRLPPLMILFAACAVASGLLNAQTRDPLPTEYQVKTAFLYNFAKFVEWPAGAFRADGESFNICVLGEDPFGHVLDETIEGRDFRGRRLQVKRILRANDAASCQILFVSSSEESVLAQVLRALDKKSVLTVGEMPRFAERGGMINFRMEQARVRFDINPGAAERAGLSVSSQLLKLAKIVREDTARGE